MRIFKFFFLFSFLFVLFGCVSNKFTYDKTIPEEQLCILRIPVYLTVVKFDETNVKWYGKNRGFFTGSKEVFAHVKIPAGEHKLTINYLRQSRDGAYKFTNAAKGIQITHDFMPNNIYTLIPQVLENEINVFIKKH